MAGTGTSAQNPKDEGKNWTTKIKEICDVFPWTTKIKEICDVQQGPYLRMWNSIFVISCVFAVSLDPLFFYVVYVDENRMCLHLDRTLRIVALLMRSLTDVTFLVHFICEICDSVQKTMDAKPGTCMAVPASKTDTQKNGPSAAVEQTWGNSGKKWEVGELIQHAWKIAQNMSWLSIILDVLALLPLPQLLIVYYPLKGSVEHQKVMNVFLLGQYVPRIFRIQLSAKVFKSTNGIWVKGLFNFFLYILASHVLGAFWYLFSIQREVSCWHEACAFQDMHTKQCMNNVFCDSQSIANITLLNKHCSWDTQDGPLRPFDYGKFLDSLKNRNSKHKLFGEKFFYSFWWGLRNLSNFGTNLTTSMYVWETLFAILISVVGLLLFIYLIGNVQTFMQMEATKTEEMRRMQMEATKTEEMRRKDEDGLIRWKKLDVRRWIDENTFPDDIKNDIMNSIEKALKNDKDADVHNPFLILPRQTKDSVKRHLFMKTLRTVKMLKGMDERVLTSICNYLRPVTYSENNFVFRMGDPLDCMLFILKGTMWTYVTSDIQAGNEISSMAIKPLREGDFYGEELLDWASDCFTEVPVSSKHVKSRKKVEAFVLMAEDLETVLAEFRPHGDLPNRNNPEEVEMVTLSAVRRFHTKAQRRPPLSPAEIGDENSDILRSTEGN